MKTIGHHTCLNKGGKKFVFRNAPFLATHDENTGKNQFLGQGYYFWDNNIEMAKYWGKKHCNGSYFIVETDIVLKEETCFDLVGNRNHMIVLIETLKILAEMKLERSRSWLVFHVIEFLKSIDVFDYESIRAIDYTMPSDIKPITLPFEKTGKHYTLINPKIAICIFEKKNILLETKRLLDK